MVIDNIQDLKNVKKYTCGSPNLCRFLEKNGMKAVYSYKLERNNRTMWVFIMTDELSKLLTQWSSNKPSNKIV